MSKRYYFKGSKFIIEDYAEQPAFTNFLPAVAGVDGRPLWAFYCNRGQGVSGFGVRGKENAVMEFFPAEIGYCEAPRKGFRTFLRIDGAYFEPFAVNGKNAPRMEISRHGFAVEETLAQTYTVRAEYFGVPNENYAALARIVTYQNVSNQTQQIELLDGLAQILPYGLTNAAFKEVGNLFKSWMCAQGAEQGYAFYKMRSSTADSSEVSEIEGGNFFVSKCDCGTLNIVVDPKLVFGQDKTMTVARTFETQGAPCAAIAAQNVENEFFCAFAHGNFTLAPHKALTIVELIGNADSLKKAENLSKTLTVTEVCEKRNEAERIVEEIACRAQTHTAFPLFDEYIEQCYFDNVLRGGMPVTFGDKVYYVYSRKHGDPERDYNAFVIEPLPYSCGNGNFRDVAQNRRNDVFFTPECGDFNVRYFFSLVQLDGYNPLSVLGVRYTCERVPAKYAAHAAFLKGEFTVGDACVTLGLRGREEIEELLANCKEVQKAAFGEGYWTDHFVYLIDLVESYLAVYPDRKEELLHRTPLRYFRSGVQVLPRDEKTVKKPNGVRRLEGIAKAGSDGWATAKDGKEVTSSLAAKLLHLIAIKAATLDPLGCGIDMEAGKPGWNDATNGLPSVFGSNVADALELARLTKICKDLLASRAIELCEEQHEFFESLLALLRKNPAAAEYYERSNAIKEAFRAKAYAGVSGRTLSVSAADVLEFLALLEERLQKGAERAKELGGGWYPTYLRFEALDYEELAGKRAEGYPCVRVTKFQAYALPHFLEGVAKGLPAMGKPLYERAKASPLYDKTLSLYRSSEPLDGESMEIGRIRSFPKGWLERESCFLHMNYKFLLSLLSAGLYEEFFQEIKTGFVPFMDPEVYGRSTLENSSFLVTSNHPDRQKWGKGFQARLTGANAEALSMWRIMMGLQRPFTVESGKLCFALQPKLPKDFFDANGEVQFLLFGKTRVIYKNRTGKDTFAPEAKIASYKLVGQNEVSVERVTGELAERVRRGDYQKIEVEIL